MDEKEQYLAITSEIIAKQIIILGPDIAVAKARGVVELKVADDGKVTDITGEPRSALQKLVNTYVELSGLIVKNALGSIFDKYPNIKQVD